MTHKNSLKNLDFLLETMRILRSPGGCPWDAEQTTESLTPYIMEEACELIDAIEDGSTEMIRDELGDLLLQVVFQAQIFAEQGIFDFHDVAGGIAEKLVRRHPHVFSPDQAARTQGELDRQWEEIKSAEGNNNGRLLADHLPSRLPSLQRAQKLITKIERTARNDELANLTGANPAPHSSVCLSAEGAINEATIGMALFQLVQTASDANIDAEAALRKTLNNVLLQLDGDPKKEIAS